MAKLKRPFVIILRLFRWRSFSIEENMLVGPGAIRWALDSFHIFVMVVYLCDKGLLESKEYRYKGSHTAEASAMISPQPIRTVTNYAAFTYEGHFTNESQ